MTVRSLLEGAVIGTADLITMDAPEPGPSARSHPTSHSWQAHWEKERLEDPQKV